MDTLLTYVPKAAQAQIKLLLEESQIEVLVTKQRLSKHGDFRFYPNKNPIITVNNSLGMGAMIRIPKADVFFRCDIMKIIFIKYKELSLQSF